ncbi:MAG: transcriptional regulator [Archangium sp.]|nr:transcriptional regulator [Archangium sp.]MDP3153550.1 transcriptional regulator [Archangium sp.]MDP3574527.1 transcriptional regulator [Archangium sp.]
MSPDRRVVKAQLRAQEDADALTLSAPDAVPRQLHVAVGDPQAPLEKFFSILDLNGLLADDGRLRPEVGLVSMGDHFDWGRPDDREKATEEGTALLSWLAAHPPDQVKILVGNHDLVRVGELSGFTDATFSEARALADLAVQPQQQAALLARYPMLASPGVITRDYSCFSVRQRTLVTRLLKARRVKLALAPAPDLLLVHAGVTLADLEPLEPVALDALSIAELLNRFLEARVTKWRGEGALDLAPLHELGSARDGEARGILAHRPANPASKQVDRASRRYDPRSLPPGITQVIGHINDKKCRELMGPWAFTQIPELGCLRGLEIGARVEYHLGCRDEDRLLFLDGAMHRVAAVEYELFDLELRQRLVLR